MSGQWEQPLQKSWGAGLAGVCGPAGRWPGCQISGRGWCWEGCVLRPSAPGVPGLTPTAPGAPAGAWAEEWQGPPGLPGEGGEPFGLGRVRGAGRPWPAVLVWESPFMAQVPGLRPLGAECWFVEGVMLLGCCLHPG